MSYCESQDVVDEFKGLDVVNGVITTTKIDEWIAQTDAYIDARLIKLYSVPITNVADLLVIKTISIGFVAQRISRILETKTITQQGDQYIPKDLIKEAKETLGLILSQDLILSGSSRSSVNGIVSSYTSDNDVERAFDVESDQW